MRPATGAPIRPARTTANGYERARPGELIHLDVRNWAASPTEAQSGRWPFTAGQGRGIGYNFVHVAIDDHTRIGYAEVLPNEKGATAAAFLTRAARYFAEHGIRRIKRVISDNAVAHRNSTAFRHAVADLGTVQRFIRPHCPWTTGKAELFNRTLQTLWAYRQVFASSKPTTGRAWVLAPALNESTRAAEPHASPECHQPYDQYN